MRAGFRCSLGKMKPIPRAIKSQVDGTIVEKAGKELSLAGGILAGGIKPEFEAGLDGQGGVGPGFRGVRRWSQCEQENTD